MNIESRNIVSEARASHDGNGVEGHGIVFNQRTHLWDNVYEEIAADGFQPMDDMLVMFNHEDNQILGRTSAGTATFSIDQTGVKYNVRELPNTSYANDLKENLRLGNVKGSSFQFIALREAWEDLEDGDVLRRVLEYKVLEMGPVTRAAYQGTDAHLRVAKRSFQALQTGENNTPPLSEPPAAETKDYNDEFRKFQMKHFQTETKGAQ